MAEVANKSPAEIKRGERPVSAPGEWHPFDTLRREIDHLFDDFGVGRWRSPLLARSSPDTEPFWRTGVSWPKAPAVDVSETDKAYEVTAELPGMDESNIEVRLADDVLTIKGEKKDEKEEKKKDYYVSERRFGSFQRAFTVPPGVDINKIEANFKNGVLTVTLPKSAQAQKSEKKIEIKKTT
jgi:HSP20 family protein